MEKEKELEVFKQFFLALPLQTSTFRRFLHHLLLQRGCLGLQVRCYGFDRAIQELFFERDDEEDELELL